MRKAFMCSLCHNGILGGGLYLDKQSVTYVCQKFTVDKKYTLLIFNKWRFDKYYKQYNETPEQ